MILAPLKLLITSYALSGAAALAVATQAQGVLTPLLAFWLGGPVAVFALATLPWVRRAFRNDARNAPPANAAEDAAAAAALLERDRAQDTPAAAARAAG